MAAARRRRFIMGQTRPLPVAAEASSIRSTIVRVFSAADLLQRVVVSPPLRGRRHAAAVPFHSVSRLTVWDRLRCPTEPRRCEPTGLAQLERTNYAEATTSGLTDCIGSERNQGSLRLTNFNAIDTISLSTGFDLSGLFDEKYSQREARFTSKQSAAAVIGKL